MICPLCNLDHGEPEIYNYRIANDEKKILVEIINPKDNFKELHMSKIYSKDWIPEISMFASVKRIINKEINGLLIYCSKNNVYISVCQNIWNQTEKNMQTKQLLLDLPTVFTGSFGDIMNELTNEMHNAIKTHPSAHNFTVEYSDLGGYTVLLLCFDVL